MNKRPMPEVNLAILKAGRTLDTHLADEEYEIALLTLRSNKKAGTARLRATKPNYTKSSEHGIAAFAWRLMVYLVSDRYEHMGFPADAAGNLSGRPGSFAHEFGAGMGARIVEALLAATPIADYRCPSQWRRQFRTLGVPGYEVKLQRPAAS